MPPIEENEHVEALIVSWKRKNGLLKAHNFEADIYSTLPPLAVLVVAKSAIEALIEQMSGEQPSKDLVKVLSVPPNASSH